MASLRIEENELLAALMTARELGGTWDTSPSLQPRAWREHYQKRLREFIELNKGGVGSDDRCAEILLWIDGKHYRCRKASRHDGYHAVPEEIAQRDRAAFSSMGDLESRMRDGETK